MPDGKILIIDDEALVRRTVGLLLTRAGYDVIEAENGRDAIDLMEQDQNWSKVMTIICDLRMPELDGAETISIFRRQYPSIPVLIMTGAPDAVLTDVLLKQQMTDYLCKPVSTQKLIQAVREATRLYELRKAQG
jgi:two-component system chemotaxis response regulator CheY